MPPPASYCIQSVHTDFFVFGQYQKYTLLVLSRVSLQPCAACMCIARTCATAFAAAVAAWLAAAHARDAAVDALAANEAALR